MSTITVFTSLSTHTCKSCGGVYAISDEFVDECRRIGGFKRMWSCPYCHTTWGFGESEADRLNRQIEEQKRIALQNANMAANARRDRDNALKEAEHFRKSRDGMKGVLVKTRKRVANATCPCCNRHFPNDKMAKHIKSKHPDFANPSVN